MQFGYVETSLDDIDFSLPPDGASTKETFHKGKNNEEIKIYVGTTKWAEKSWIGKIYPKGVSDKEYLKIYAQNFNTIEFGPTFYVMQTKEAIKSWADQVEAVEGFKFCPKYPQAITHVRGLENADKQTTDFYDSLSGFGNHLGPLLLQLSERFSPKKFNQLVAYLKSIPQDKQVALEVRNKDWFSNTNHRKELFDLLRECNVCSIISDTAGRRDCVHMELPTKDVVIRFVGNNLHPTDYTRVDAWVSRLNEWKEQGLDSIWFFVHQHDERNAPDLCDYLIKQLNSTLSIEVKRPSLL
jgi:uncharacterized protein YecE (DUF72 family)